MRGFLQLIRALVLLLFAAVWFETVAHTAVCHSENPLCGHDGGSESTVCLCPCHVALEPSEGAVFIAATPTPCRMQRVDESVRALLLPDDIFRPPLA